MAFNIAVSGLNAASADLDVISNNVANSNTTGFKRSRAEFVDVFAIADLGAAEITPGSGVRVSDIQQQFTQGNITFTDNNLDLAISGRGFFIVDDGGGQAYTRNGAFGVDRNGFIANSQGQQLIAFDADNSGNITGASGPLQVNTANITPQASTNIDLQLNLDASQTPPPVAVFNPTDLDSFNSTTSTSIFDSLGNSHLASFFYVNTAVANTFDTYTLVDGVQVSGPDTLAFSPTGSIVTPAGGTLTTPPFPVAGGGAPLTLTLDYSNTTQFGSPFAVNSLSQDGFSTGRLSSVDIEGDGIIFARFTNGQSRIEGQIAIADFPNSQGLQPISDTSFVETFTSGSVIIGAPGTASLGLLQSGALEEANVDLSQELVDMIIAQRNFQANAELIQTADSITQTIINIR